MGKDSQFPENPRKSENLENLLQQRDNFRIVPCKNFRFIENRIRFSLAGDREEDLDGRGNYHDEQKRS
jgi:hypothetical protein